MRFCLPTYDSCMQGGPLLVLHEVKNPYKGPYEWETGDITPIQGVMTLHTTGSGPPCVTQKE